jgi:hypothetical protein
VENGTRECRKTRQQNILIPRRARAAFDGIIVKGLSDVDQCLKRTPTVSFFSLDDTRHVVELKD